MDVRAGLPSAVERVDLELGSQWLGTWTPGEMPMEFPSDVGVPLTASALFTARITYRALASSTLDYSHLRIWIAKEERPKTLREVTVVRSWRAPAAVDLLAIQPARNADPVDVVARFADGRAEALGSLSAPSRGRHPLYRLIRPFALPAGARVDTSGPVRMLYSGGATRRVNANVRTRPRR